MRYTPTAKKLWIVRVTVPVAAAEPMTDAFENAVSISVYAPPRQNRAVIEAHFDHDPDRVDLSARLAVASMIAGIAAPEPEIDDIPNLDWLKKVAADFPPLKIARWTVYGAEHRRAVANHRLALQIDATSAFGTGEHPTTRGCLVMLDRVLKGGKNFRRIADIGCGSGILAMAAVKSYRGIRAVAVDLDPESVRIAKDNATRNGLRSYIRIDKSFGYKAPVVRRHAPYDLILSNIFAGPLSIMAKDLKRYLAPGGTVILSGLLTNQANRVIVAHRRKKLFLTRKICLGEWCILEFHC